jgi:hypothetical protein
MYNTPSGGGIYKTTDAGATWTRVGTPAMFNTTSFPDIVHFFDAQHGVAIGDPNTTSFEIWTTADYGQTWTQVNGANIPAPDASGEYGIVNLFSAVDSTIWFGTDIGNIYKSTDMGLTWTKYSTGMIVAAQTIEDMAFVDSVHGFTMQGGLLYASADGGATWNQITYTGPLFQGELEPVPGTHTLITTGSSSTTGFGSSYSQDYGLTWNLIDTNVSHTAADFYNETTGWSGEVSDGTIGGAYMYNGMALAVPLAAPSIDATIYPNPSNGTFNLNMKGINEPVVISVYDITGKIISETKYSPSNNNSTLSFVLANVNKGVHQVVISGATVHRTCRMIVE